MNKKNKILLLAVIITTIIVATFAFSKYQSTMASKSNASPAIPVISLTSNILNVDLEVNPIEEQNYIFKVSNYDDMKNNKTDTTVENKSEVTMQYTLQLKNLDILPLEFELYEYDEEKSEISGENLLANNITEKIIMDSKEKNTKTYMLKIKWEENKENYLYSKEIDRVQLILNSEQVD